MSEVTQLFREHRLLINDIVPHASQRKTTIENAALASASRINFYSLAAGIAIAACLIAVSWAFGVTVRRRLRRLTKAAELIAHGELEVELDTESKDEIGRVSAAFEHIVRSLRNVTDELSGRH